MLARQKIKQLGVGAVSDAGEAFKSGFPDLLASFCKSQNCDFK
jgi:hypothetical protein